MVSEPRLPPEDLKKWGSYFPAQQQQGGTDVVLQSQPPAVPGLSAFRFYFPSHQRENPGTCFICKSLYILHLNYTPVSVLNTSLRVFLLAHAIAEAVCVSHDKATPVADCKQCACSYLASNLKENFCLLE